MNFRQVFCPTVLLLLLVVATGCSAPLPPKNAEMLQDAESFRPLTTVPARPSVKVPLGDRQQLEDQLRDNNATARRLRVQQGYAEPTLPTTEPDLPMELPNE